MIPAFTEAVRATTQPCTLLLVAAPLLVALATRGRWWPLIGTLVGAAIGGWVFIANVIVLSDTALRVSGVLVAAALGVLAAATARVDWAMRTRAGEPRVQAVVAAGVAFISTLWWRPCVGTELGAILTNARDGIVPEFPAMTAYMLGAMVPVVAVTLVIRVIDPSRRATVWLTGGAAVGGLLIGGALALDRYDGLVTTLTRWSTA